MIRSLVSLVVLTSLGAPVLAQAPPSASESPVVLTVNGQPVRQVEVQQMMQNLSRTLSQRGQKIEQQQLQQAAVKELVDMKLLVQEAQRRELAIDPTEVEATFKGLEARAGGGESFASFLAQNGLTAELVQTGIREGALIRQLIETQIRPGVGVSDEEVSTFYQANPDSFRSDEQVHARHILRIVAPDASAEVKATARQEAAAARQRALAGEDFGTLAGELSQGPNAGQGGDLGFISATQMVEPFSTAAFALPIGGISEVVETRFGYHVIKVEAKRPAGILPFGEVAEQLRAELEGQQLGAAIEALLVPLRSAAEVVPTPPAGEPPVPG